jgi:hypothetical protein
MVDKKKSTILRILLYDAIPMNVLKLYVKMHNGWKKLQT